MAKRKNQREWEIMRRFPIGEKVVVVREMVDRGGRRGVHDWSSERVASYDGWIAGATWVCNGKVETVHYPAVVQGDDVIEPSSETYLNISEKVPVFLVRRSLFGKAARVPVDGVVHSRERGVCPVMKGGRSVIGASGVEALSKEARSRKRDSRGRFLKME